MARFSDVPTEVIDHILTFTPRSNLPNLCLVNKSLHRSAELFLYSSIKIKWDSNHKNPPIVALLRTLLQRPELLICIDEVDLHGIYFHDHPERPSLDLDATDISLDQFIDTINKAQVSFSSLWIDRLRSGKMDAFTGLLIANLTHISCLKINHNFINGDDILAKVLLSKVFGPLPAFKRLKKMIYAKRMDRQVWERNEIFPCAISLFYLPTVTSLMVSMSNPETFQWPAEEPNLDHLTSLSICWCIEPYVAEILALTPNLKSLYWSWIYHDSTNDELEIPELDFNEIIEVLSLVRGTLEKLIFSMVIGDDGYDRVSDVTFLGSFNGLREFGNLKLLSIPLVCLTGIGTKPLPLEDSIPAGLEVLHLRRQSLYEFGLEEQWKDDLDYKGVIHATGQMIQSLVETHSRLHLVTAIGRKIEVRTERCALDCHT